MRLRKIAFKSPPEGDVREFYDALYERLQVNLRPMPVGMVVREPFLVELVYNEDLAGGRTMDPVKSGDFLRITLPGTKFLFHGLEPRGVQ